jgi:N-acetylglutamate synthase-like GNAT family acetyltransferase
MIIRNALTNDAAVIKELIQQLGYEISTGQVEKNIGIYEQAKGHVLVMEDKNEVIGFIAGAYIPLFHQSELMFRITALCVNNANKTKGAGRQLVNAIEVACKKNQCYYVEVTSGAHRKEEAHPFYVKLGYTLYDGKRFRKVLEQ